MGEADVPELADGHDSHEGICHETFVIIHQFFRVDHRFVYFEVLKNIFPQDAREKPTVQLRSVDLVFADKENIADRALADLPFDVQKNSLLDPGCCGGSFFEDAVAIVQGLVVHKLRGFISFHLADIGYESPEIFFFCIWIASHLKEHVFAGKNDLYRSVPCFLFHSDLR